MFINQSGLEFIRLYSSVVEHLFRISAFRSEEAHSASEELRSKRRSERLCYTVAKEQGVLGSNPNRLTISSGMEFKFLFSSISLRPPFVFTKVASVRWEPAHPTLS